MRKPAATRPVREPSEDEWKVAQEEFLRKEARRRKIEGDRRKAAMKRLGAEKLTPAEIGWAAGFWDGEGHCNARERNGEFHCSLDQEDRVLLERLEAAVGVGQISPIKRRLSANGKMQFIYTYRITNQPDLERLWTAIGIHLGPAKAEQFARAMSVPIHTILRKEKPMPEGIRSAVVRARARRSESNGKASR